MINWSGGLLAVVSIFVFTRAFLGNRSGILAALIYYTLPLVGHFSFADMKIDNLVFFYGAAATLAAMLAVFPHIAAHLELNGREIVVKSDPSRKPPRVTRVTPGADDADWLPADTIDKARAGMLALGQEIGFFPVWELGRKKSSCLFASLYPQQGAPKIGCTRQLLATWPAKIVDAEITMLMTAHAYAHRLHQAGKVCALGAAVSFETLTGFHNRIRVITALKSLRIPPEGRLLLKIEDVPQGTPLGKLAEIIAMLAVPNVRFTVQFRNCQAVPGEVDIRLGAAGLGFALPNQYDAGLATIFMKRLAHAFPGFVFVEGLDTPELAAAAQACGVRFGTGQAVSRMWFSGDEKLPVFPLHQG
jgi:hypothetical protein